MVPRSRWMSPWPGSMNICAPRVCMSGSTGTCGSTPRTVSTAKPPTYWDRAGLLEREGAGPSTKGCEPNGESSREPLLVVVWNPRYPGVGLRLGSEVGHHNLEPGCYDDAIRG